MIENLSLSFDISRIGMFTDIHFGAHHNSTQHNEDCLKFIDWFIQQCKRKNIDTIFFLGDWFEHRNSISTLTQKYSICALRKLNQSGFKVIFLIGNHDLYHRHNREVHSAEFFKELENLIIIDNPCRYKDILLLPYLFKDEYPMLVNDVNKSTYVFGHLEFRNFFLTGTNSRSEIGYQHQMFSGPKYIFSGHFHKRQATDNIIYIGNPFGTSYADAGDYSRGACFLDMQTNEVDFEDYEGPSYIKTSLSILLDDLSVIKQYARIKCILDVDISYSEAQSLKKDLIETFNLRELSLEENAIERQQALSESTLDELDELDLSILNETVKKLIETGVQATTTINPKTLTLLYSEL